MGKNRSTTPGIGSGADRDAVALRPVTQQASSQHIAAKTSHGRKAVGTAVAAVALAAVTVLSGPGLVAGAATFEPGSIIGSPPNSASSRIAGVHEDMARAVELRQLTPQQAAFMENQLVRRIQAEA